MKKLYFLLLFFACFSSCREEEASEQNPVAVDTLSTNSSSPLGGSTRNEHSEVYNSLGSLSESEWDSVQGHGKGNPYTTQHAQGAYKVFGWHPYFLGSTYTDYNYSLLWGIAYFAYKLDPASGSYESIHNWKTTAMVDSAQKYGTKVFLTVDNFGSAKNKTFLNNATARQTLIDSLEMLLDARNADGVCLDFEGVGAAEADSLSSFVRQLSTKLKSNHPQRMVILAVYAVDWHKVFQVEALLPHVDLFTLMGYDYYYCGSSLAGPVAPLNSGDRWSAYNLQKSVDYYLNAGIPKSKLIAALPYYGRQWSTESENIPAKTVKCLASPKYSQIREMAAYDEYALDSISQTQYLKLTNEGNPQQLWFDGVKSLGAKWDWIKKKGLAGTGMWALGYDHGYPELWKLLGEKFGGDSD